MTIRAENRTRAALAAKRPQRPPAFTPAELRDRRRAGLPVTLGGGWFLAAEVASICCPLAERVAGSPRPHAYWRQVDDLALAVHGLVHAVVGLLVRADAERRTKHLHVDERGSSIRALADLAPRPTLPEIGDDAMLSGTWATSLVALADPYNSDLSDLLGNALTWAVSDRVLAALREVDLAALALGRRLDRDEQARAERAATTATAPTAAHQARVELQRFGISI